MLKRTHPSGEVQRVAGRSLTQLLCSLACAQAGARHNHACNKTATTQVRVPAVMMQSVHGESQYIGDTA